MNKELKVGAGYFLLGICLLVACANTERKKQEVACDYTGWSDPVSLGDSTDVLFGPSIVTRDSRIYVGGTLEPALRSDNRRDYMIRPVDGDAFFLTHDSQRGYFVVVMVVDKSGDIHTLWGEPPDTIAVNNKDASDTDLYYSRYREGQWSTQEHVYHYPPGLHWSSYTLKNFVADNDGNLHTVVTNYHSFERAGTFQYVRKDKQGWHVRDTKIRGSAPFLTVGPTGELLLTYLAAQLPENAKRGDSDQNSIFFTISTDDGVTWAEPVLVSRSGDLPGDKPRIVLMPDSTIHVLWLKAIVADAISQVLWHAISNDGGQKWSEPVEIGTGLGGRLIMFQAVATPEGCLHMVFERESDFLSADQQLYYTWWNGSEWSEPERPFPQTYSLQFALAVSDYSIVHLTWMQRPTAAWPSPTADLMPGPGEWPRQAYSINRPH